MKRIKKSSNMLEFSIERTTAQIAVIQLSGRIMAEYETIPLTEQLEDLQEEGIHKLIFDLGKLEYMNSAGLNFLLRTLTRVRREDGEVVLCALNTLLETLIVTAKLNAFFTICADLPEALLQLDKEKA